MDVVITETDTTVYLDGEYAGNTASSYKLGGILGEEGGILQIGKANWENGEYFNGLLDNLQIYCRAKTAEELALPDTEEAVVGRAASRLEIPGLDDIRGNISLPDQIEGAAVSWKIFGSFTGTEGSPMDEQIYFAVSTDGYYYTDLNHCRPVLESHIGERGVRDPYLMRSAEGDKFYLLATDLSIYYRGGWGSAKATTTGSRDLIIWESTDLVNWSEPRAVAVGTEDAG